ncbi:hypothetical protein CSB09_02530 [Candidatus Gracilibacteria bacterium]|nr:MAG: hypothetical protein CSB09_02530 [Candidatus Gracilibacteria bacterium]
MTLTNYSFHEDTPPHTAIMAEVGGIIGMVGNKAMEGLSQSRENMRELLGRLEDLVTKERNKINYNYADYEERLCQSNEVFEKTLQEKVLSISEIRNMYDEIISLFPEDSQELAEKRIQEEYLADLVFESMENKELGQFKVYEMYGYTSGIKKNNLKMCKNEIKKIQGNEMKKLVFDWCDLGKYLGTDGIVDLMKILEGRGIRYLDLVHNRLGEYLGVDGMIALIKTLHGSGVRGLNLGDNALGKYLTKDEMMRFTRALKGSGIQYLSLAGNELGEYFTKNEIFEFAKVLGGSGLRSLNLWSNELSEEFQQELIEAFPNIHFEF